VPPRLTALAVNGEVSDAVAMRTIVCPTDFASSYPDRTSRHSLFGHVS
jgi:hypothetical protein